MAQPRKHTAPPSGPDYLTIRQAAELWGVHPLTIRRRVASGDLPAVRCGPRIIRVKRSDVDALMKPIPTAQGGAA